MTQSRRIQPALLTRTLIGLVLAPVIGGAVVFAGLAVPGLTDGGDPDVFRLVGTGAWLGLVIGAPGAIVLGWPLHLLLMKLRWTNVFAYMALGPVLGFAAFFTSSFVLGWGSRF